MSDNDTTSGGSIDDLSIGDIDKELAAIDEKLNTIPADDFSERVDLHERHLELRTRAAELNADADRQRSTGDIEIEIQSLRQRIAAVQGVMIDTAVQDSEGNVPGPDQKDRSSSTMNREIADARGVPAMENQLRKLEGILADRDVNTD